MKILAISQFYTPDITAAAFRIAETVEDLREFGNKVEVVTTYPHKSDVFHDIESGIDGVYRVTLPDTENKGFLGYIYMYVSFMLKSIIKGFKVGRRQKPDIVWASSPPIFVGLAGWVVARILGVKFALDIRDIWPDSAVAADQISDSGSAYKVGRWMERFLYSHADLITCVAVPMKNYIKEYTDTKIKVIYNGVETSISGEDQKSEPLTALDSYASIPDSRKILYAGNFGHVQQLDLLVDMISELQPSVLNEKWEIFFLGGGAKKESLIELVNSHGLSEKIHFLDPVPKEEVFHYLKSADVLFIHLMDSEVLRLTIPSKVFDYMLADRPLLAGIHGEGKRIIDSIEGNFTFISGDKESLKKTFKELDQAISEGRMPDNAAKVRNHYSRQSQSQKLNTTLNKLHAIK